MRRANQTFHDEHTPKDGGGTGGAMFVVFAVIFALTSMLYAAMSVPSSLLSGH